MTSRYKKIGEFYKDVVPTDKAPIVSPTPNPRPPPKPQPNPRPNPQPNPRPNTTQGDKLNIVWEEKTYTNSSDPEVFGPALWFSLHNASVKYPEKASPIAREKMRGVIIGLPMLVPCDNCFNHCTSFVESKWEELDTICSTRENLFNFFVDFHNKVNQRHGKPLMSYEDAWKLYTSPIKITKMRYSSDI